eukprot:4792491-Prymnesium_polylepis.3
MCCVTAHSRLKNAGVNVSTCRYARGARGTGGANGAGTGALPCERDADGSCVRVGACPCRRVPPAVLC